MEKVLSDWEDRKIEIVARVEELLDTPKAREITILITCKLDEADSIKYQIEEVG